MTLDLVTAPVNPMLSTAEANAHLRVDIDTEDDLKLAKMILRGREV